MALTIVDIELEIRIHSKTMKTLDRQIVHDFLDLKYVYFFLSFVNHPGRLQYRTTRWVRSVEAIVITQFITGAHKCLINEFPNTRVGPFEGF